jgi:carbonic anhydrase
MLSPRHVSFRFAMLLLCAASGLASASGDFPHWTYGGEEGPGYWGDLSEQFATCKLGQAQSPINIVSTEAKKADLPALEFAYREIPLNIQNNGHTIQVAASGAGGLKLGEDSYELAQFHFHAPSEHQIDGKPAEMVAHLVHKNAQGKLAVVGVLFEQGEANPLIDALWAAIPAQVGEAQSVAGVEINPAQLLPAERNYYTYTGSLTTPPCSEGVKWLVLKQPVSLSAAQIARYAGLYPHSARPVQPRNTREVQSSN